jgi:hypothetical protein
MHTSDDTALHPRKPESCKFRGSLASWNMIRFWTWSRTNRKVRGLFGLVRRDFVWIGRHCAISQKTVT